MCKALSPHINPRPPPFKDSGARLPGEKLRSHSARSAAAPEPGAEEGAVHASSAPPGTCLLRAGSALLPPSSPPRRGSGSRRRRCQPASAVCVRSCGCKCREAERCHGASPRRDALCQVPALYFQLHLLGQCGARTGAAGGLRKRGGDLGSELVGELGGSQGAREGPRGSGQILESSGPWSWGDCVCVSPLPTSWKGSESLATS